MRSLRLVTIAVALLLAAGEVARWWGNPRFLPLAFDELLVAAALLGAAAVSRRTGPAPLVAAWGLFCGLLLALLAPTLDHLLSGPPKQSAGFYAAILTGMLAIGLGALLRALRLARSDPATAAKEAPER